MDSTQASGGVFKLGGDLPVDRLGFGTMQLTGPGVWGAPADRESAIAVLRRAVDLGVNLIDTADCYGPHVSEEMIRQALHPYPENLVIATKGGLLRPGPDQWIPLGRPAYLRQQVELSLRNLKMERIDLYQLHRVDPDVPLADQVGELRQLQQEGKIRHIGLSEVDTDQIAEARTIAEIVSVQNMFNFAVRQHETVLDYATEQGIAFIPWFPIASGQLARRNGPLDHMARKHGVSPAQLSLAWLLHRSPVMLPIPGTRSLEHLEENVRARDIVLSDEFAALTGRTD